LTRQFVGLGIPAVAFVTVIIYPLFHHFYDFLTMGPANSPFVNPTSTPRFRLSIAWVCLCTLRNARVLPPFCFFWVLSYIRLSRWHGCALTRSIGFFDIFSLGRGSKSALVASWNRLLDPFIMPDRTFLRRMIDLLCCFRNRDHPIRRVSSRFTGFRRDLQWWLSFFLEWDGVSLFLFPSISLLPDLVVPQMPLVRAVLVLCGAMSGFAVRGSSCPLLRSITSMELMSIVVAAHLWGSAWSRLRVQLLCNNLGWRTF
jgi:hypothetical protein